MQAIKLSKHVKNPITKAVDTPNVYFIFKVKKTLTISPTSGKIKVNPASFPIQLDDMFA